VSDESPLSPLAEIVVLERVPRLSPAIRRRIIGRRAAVRDVRTVPDLVACLEARPEGGLVLAVVDFAVAPGAILLALADWRDRLPRCRWFVLLDESTRHAEWGLREAGAARVDFAPGGIEELATVCEASLPPREAAERSMALDLLSRYLR
jgi:hypothetical protein